MKVRDLVGRRVMDVSSATQVASVVAPILDPSQHRVVGFRVAGDRPVLPWDSIKAVGADALTVEGSDSLREVSTDPEQRAANGSLDPLGSRVLDEDGAELGMVDDVEFDPGSGVVTEIVVAGATLPGDRLLGFGDYALVLARSRDH